MASFANSDGISSIHMSNIVRKFFCPIGQSFCTYEIEIIMEPRRVICDYLEVGNFIKDMGMNQTLESACGIICDHMTSEYEPHSVMVQVGCRDAKHMPVRVTKTVRRGIDRRGKVEYR